MIRIWIGAALLAAGLFFCVSAAVGLFRFRTVLNRMHAAAMADTMGLLLIALGAAVLRGPSFAAAKLLLLPVFFCLTSPVTSHLIAHVEVLHHGNAFQEYREEERGE